ncbi:MAG TPA: MarC family protein [Tepidisphaeraceae bacterium]|jgi:multiple antibiotic resistance protein
MRAIRVADREGMDLLRAVFRDVLPLFVTIDAVGSVPIFLALTRGLTPSQRRTITFEAVAGATAIAIGFMFVGNALFGFLGITITDFQIAGGILLLVLAVLDLLSPGKPAVDESEAGGLVPLAMPLIAGPATLTTTLVLARRDGVALTLLALAINFLFLLFVLLGASRIARLVGVKGLSAVSKLVMVLLSAIAVSFIREGVTNAVLETIARSRGAH